MLLIPKVFFGWSEFHFSFLCEYIFTVYLIPFFKYFIFTTSHSEIFNFTIWYIFEFHEMASNISISRAFIKKAVHSKPIRIVIHIGSSNKYELLSHLFKAKFGKGELARDLNG